MGKRYFCDYCNKSFADNPVSRKTHLNGVVHAQNKKAHYDSFRDEEEILRDESRKKPCRAFLSTGDCKFGDRCQYSHLTNEDRQRLSEIIQFKKQQAAPEDHVQAQGAEDQNSVAKSLNSWVEKRAKERANQDTSEDIKSTKLFVEIPHYRLAQCFEAVSNIPPSLIPPAEEQLLTADYSEWG